MLRVIVSLSFVAMVGPGVVQASLRWQDEQSGQLINGDMETAVDNAPIGWGFGAQTGDAALHLETEDPYEGLQSVLIDATNATATHEVVGTIAQSIDGRPWRGKRIRFRAFVRTSDLGDSTGAQLWFRVDRESQGNAPSFGAFDNMDDRPIQSDQWQSFDIILQIDDDAERLAFGMFLRGAGKAWLDNVTLEEVDSDTPTTDSGGSISSEGDANQESTSSGSQNSGRFQMAPILMQAFADAENAPQQPFYSHWLWLALIAVVLFGLSAIPGKEIEVQHRKGHVVRRNAAAFVPKFALRFSVAYWLLYCLPAPFNYLTGHFGDKVGGWFQEIYGWYANQVTAVVTWVAEHIFKISDELVPPNGSGDTTYNFIQVFTIFAISLLVAAIWSAADWRKTDYRIAQDVLRSFLRYVLAVTMLGYGLAKLGWDSNQFPPLGDYQLDRTWGDSSPMGVLWSFMGASRTYTFFAGLGEAIGGSLLLFRRTTLLGCFVVTGVMINVMMLNYCYDVPVKLYSTHLVCMALFILLPNVGRLTRLLLLNRPTEPVNFRPPYAGKKTIWVQRALKCGLIVLALGFPMYKHAERQFKYFEEQANQPEFFGQFDVVEFKLNDQVITGSVSTTPVWQTVKFERLAYNQDMERVPTNWMSIGIDGGTLVTTFSIDENAIKLANQENALYPDGRWELVEADDDVYLLIGNLPAGQAEVKLARQSGETHRLTDRGYRWINEVPFNR